MSTTGTWASEKKGLKYHKDRSVKLERLSGRSTHTRAGNCDCAYSREVGVSTEGKAREIRPGGLVAPTKKNKKGGSRGKGKDEMETRQGARNANARSLMTIKYDVICPPGPSRSKSTRDYGGLKWNN